MKFLKWRALEASIAVVLIFFMALKLHIEQDCQTLECLITQHLAIIPCPRDDWACLIQEQVRFAPPFVIDSAARYLKLTPDSYTTLVTMVVNPTEEALYVNYFRASCDSVGFCISQYGILLRYTHDGWSHVEARSGAPSAPCATIYRYYLYGIQQDNVPTLYYGRVNANRSTCTALQDRYILALNENSSRTYREQTAFVGMPTPSP